MSKLVESKHTDVPFELCFKYPLEKGYTFKELSKINLKRFQSFLDKVAKMTADQVNVAFSKTPDTDDEYKDMQVYHYAVSDKFRIHVVVEDDRFKVIRLDPNHNFHGK